MIRPHFLSKRPQWLAPPPDAVTTNADESDATKLVVRNTFLELQEAVKQAHWEEVAEVEKVGTNMGW